MAFVPGPLPPDEMPLLALMPRLLAEANHALGELHGIGRTLPDATLLVRPYLRREAVLSSRIEGTRTSFSELVTYEAEGQPALTSDAREVANYVHALESGLRRVHEQPGITPDLVRTLHRSLLSGARGEESGTPGEFRTVQNHIGGGEHPADGVFVPPPPDRMQTALDAFFDYILKPKPDTPVLVEAAWMHYQFEAIHPFIDGNGRVGRLLIPLLLAERRQLEHPLLYLSPYFERRRSEYYDHLFAVSARGEWVEWLRFFLEGVLAQARSAIALADAVLTLRAEWDERLGAAAPTARRLAQIVLEHVAVSAPTVRHDLGVTLQTVYNALSTLEAAGIVEEITGRTRGRIYASPELLELLQTPS